jgi:hypothetical protein
MLHRGSCAVGLMMSMIRAGELFGRGALSMCLDDLMGKSDRVPVPRCPKHHLRELGGRSGGPDARDRCRACNVASYWRRCARCSILSIMLTANRRQADSSASEVTPNGLAVGGVSGRVAYSSDSAVCPLPWITAARQD